MGLTERLARGCAAHPRRTLRVLGRCGAGRPRARGDLAARTELAGKRRRQSGVDEGEGHDRPGVPRRGRKRAAGRDRRHLEPVQGRLASVPRLRQAAGRPRFVRPERCGVPGRSPSRPTVTRPSSPCTSAAIRARALSSRSWRRRTVERSKWASPATTRPATTSASSRRRISRRASSPSACRRLWSSSCSSSRRSSPGSCPC